MASRSYFQLTYRVLDVFSSIVQDKATAHQAPDVISLWIDSKTHSRNIRIVQHIQSACRPTHSASKQTVIIHAKTTYRRNRKKVHLRRENDQRVERAAHLRTATLSETSFSQIFAVIFPPLCKLHVDLVAVFC